MVSVVVRRRLGSGIGVLGCGKRICSGSEGEGVDKAFVGGW